MPDNIINQTWQHVFESHSKKKYNKKISFVFDFIAFNDYYYFDFNGLSFANLYVKNRITGGELPYIFIDDNIKISLGNMENYPPISKISLREILEESKWDSENIHDLILEIERNKYNIRHVKLEIGYDLIEENTFLQNTIFNKDIPYRSLKDILHFIKTCFAFIVDFFSKNNTKFYNMRHCYESYYQMDKFMQPEFNLHLPHGLELDENSIILTYYINNPNDPNDPMIYKEFINDSKESPKNNPIYISKNNIKNNSTLLLQSEFYNNLYNKNFLENFNRITLEYKTKYLKKYLLVPLFGVLTVLLSLVEVFSSNMLIVPFMALISFIVLYLTLERENYTYPFKRSTFILVLESGLLLFVKTFLFLSQKQNTQYYYKIFIIIVLNIIVIRFFFRYLKIK